MSFAQMGLRFLARKRMQTSLTILAIVLGVGILTGVNVTADSIEVSINAQIYGKLGNNDIVVRSNRSVDGGWFNYVSGQNLVNSIEGVESSVPRIIKSHPSYPLLNSSGWNVPTIALDTTSNTEKTYGICNITDALYSQYINTSQLENLFQAASTVQFPVVISKDYANSFGSVPGDPLYFYPEDPSFFGGNADRTNSSTWLNATIIGIIQDTSEAVQDFMPPARIWELYPPSRAVYIDINDAWSYVFNAHQGQVNMLFAQSSDPTQIDITRERIEAINSPTVFPNGIFTENVKGLFTDGILQVNFLMRGIFSIFAGISLLVCAIIIKNLLEMAKEEQTLQIGIMRAIGVTKKKILGLYIYQILFISIIGSLIGLVVGYFLSNLFVGSYVNTADAVGTDFSQYQIQPEMSGSTIAIGLFTGIAVSLVFGFFPARSAANVDPLRALRSMSEKPQESLTRRAIKKTSSLTISILLTVGGIAIIGSAFGGLFILDIINPEVIALLFGGVVILIVGIVFLGAFFFPAVVPALSGLFTPILQKMRILTGRNLRRYSRQSKNTFSMLAVGLCMMITVGTIMNSAYEGAYPGGKTITGGDLAIGDFGNGHININHTTNLNNLPSVAQAVPIRFSLGFEGLTQIDALSTNQTFGGTTDSLFGAVTEDFHIGILEPQLYAALHEKESIVRLDDKDVTLTELMNLLDNPYSIILQDRLARRVGNLKTGEWVRVRFEGFEAKFQVVGIFEILPGFYWSYYSTDSAFEKQFVGAISWNTYDRLVDDNIGDIDVVAKNALTPPEEYSTLIPDENLWGYTSTPIDYTSLASIANQTGMVQNSVSRITSPFWSLPPFQWQTNLTLYDPSLNLSDYSSSEAGNDFELNDALNQTWALQNVLWHESGSIDPEWNSMLSRASVINPDQDSGFGNTSIVQKLESIPNNVVSLEEIIAWGDENIINQEFCVVNELYVNLNISTGNFDYIKKFVPGETIRMYYNDTIYTDLLIIATTNSHYNYNYIDDEGNHHTDTAVFNYEALNFNWKTAESGDWSYFFEVLDIEPNSIFLSPNLEINETFYSNLLPSLINQTLSGYLNNSSENNETQPYEIPESLSLWWLNETLGTLFASNSSGAGNVTTDSWVGNYTYDDYHFTFDGATFTFQDTTEVVNISLNMNNGTDALLGILNGSDMLTLQNFTSLMYFDLNDGASLEDIRNFMDTMTVICSQVPTLANITFFSPKLFLIEESGLYDVYFLVGATSKNTVDNAFLEIKDYYLSHDLPWKDSWVDRSTEMEEDVGGILGLIVDMFFGVLSFALITSLVGLAISTIISLHKRYAEIGTLRTLGFSNNQILKMIVGEGVITAIYGIIIGLIAGLLIAYLIISNLPFMIFLPIIFAPPTTLIFQGLALLVLASVVVSFLPALSATKIDIAEAIRTKGE